MRLMTSGIALVFAMVIGILVVGQAIDLGAEGQGLSGGVGTFFDTVPMLMLILVVAGVGAGSLTVFFAMMFRR